MTPIAVDVRAERIETSSLPENFTLLQVVPALDGGGVEEACLDLAKCVAAAGGRSLVASRGGRLEARLVTNGSLLIRLPAQARDPFSLAANAARLAAVIRRESVSIVHVRSRAPAISALAATRWAGAPLIATYHGAYSASWPMKRWFNRVMTTGEWVIAPSRFIADHVAAEHPRAAGKVVLVPEGVDVDYFDPQAVSPARVEAVRSAWRLPAGTSVILLAGRLAAIKGQLIAVQALAGITAEPPPILVLAGTESQKGQGAAIAAAAQRLQLGDSVRLVGPCADMPAAYLAADIVVAPSTAPESFGRSLVEAAAMARPVLASRLGAFCETIADGQTGWLAPPGDPDAWTKALAKALSTSPEERSRMGKAARDRAVRLYSLAAMCEATFALYREVLEGRE